MIAAHPTLALATRRFNVALLGLSKFERAAQLAWFRSEVGLPLGLRAIDELAGADFVVANAEDPNTVQAVVAAGLVHETIFVGGQAPAEAMSWMHRPIDPRRVVRTLAAMVDLDANEITTSRASCFCALEAGTDW